MYRYIDSVASIHIWYNSSFKNSIYIPIEIRFDILMTFEYDSGIAQTDTVIFFFFKFKQIMSIMDSMPKKSATLNVDGAMI